MYASRYAQGVPQSVSDSPLKASRNFPHVTAANAVLRHSQKQRTEVEFIPGEGERVRFGERHATGKLLQPDRRLPFKRNFTRKTEKGCGSIKQAPHRSRGKRADVLAHQLHRAAVALGKSKGRGKHIWHAIHLSEEASRRLHWKMRSSIAAGERRLAQVSRACEALLHAADKNLASPDGSIVSVSGA